MKKMIVLTLIALFSISSFAKTSVNIENFTGEYRGVMVSDSSPIGIGEYILTIKKNSLLHTMATGTRILNEEEAVVLTPMSANEVKNLFAEGSNEHKRVSAFSVNGSHPYYLFFNGELAKGDFALIVINRPDSMVGLVMPYTTLFNKEQVDAGNFKKFINTMVGKNKLPLIENEGKVLKD